MRYAMILIFARKTAPCYSTPDSKIFKLPKPIERWKLPLLGQVTSDRYVIQKIEHCRLYFSPLGFIFKFLGKQMSVFGLFRIRYRITHSSTVSYAHINSRLLDLRPLLLMFYNNIFSIVSYTVAPSASAETYPSQIQKLFRRGGLS